MAKSRARNPEVFYDGSKLVDADSTALSGIYTTYATVAAMNAAAPAANTIALLLPSAFTGTGKPTVSIPVIYNGTVWEPFGGSQVIFKVMLGTLAVPTVVLGAVGRFPLAVDPIIPGGLLATNGDTLEIQARSQKHGVAGTGTIRLWLGTDTTYTNNSFLTSFSITAVDLQHTTMTTEVIRTSATTLFSSGNAVANGNSGASVFADKSTLINFAENQTITVAMNALTAADTYDLLELEVVWKMGTLA